MGAHPRPGLYGDATVETPDQTDDNGDTQARSLGRKSPFFQRLRRLRFKSASPIFDLDHQSLIHKVRGKPDASAPA